MFQDFFLHPQSISRILSPYSFIFIYRRMAKMTKSQFLDALASKTGHTKKDMATMLDALTEVVYVETKKSGECTVPGLGKMVKKNRAARMGRNPATGEQIKIAAKTTLKFRVAKAAKDSIL